MLLDLFHQIYASDLSKISVAMLVLLIAWSVFGALFYKKMRLIGTVLAVVFVAVIIYGTILSRTTGVRTHDFIPFSSFYKAVEQTEIYRSMLMNIFLFIPIGLTLPFAFKGSKTKCFFLATLCGFSLSVAIEIIQLCFSLGLAETDDIICNTIGTTLGCCSYLLASFWRAIMLKYGKDKKTNE